MNTQGLSFLIWKKKKGSDYIVSNVPGSLRFHEWKVTLHSKDSLLSEEYNQIPFKYSAPGAHISAYYFQIINCLT